MPDYVIEQAQGRLTQTDIQGASNTPIHFMVILENLQTASEVAAFNALNNPASVPDVMPQVYDGQRLVNVELIERVRIGVYRFRCEYELADSDKSEDDQKLVDEWTVSFDTKGATVNKNRSESSKFYNAAGRQALQDNTFNNLIGLSIKDGVVSAAGVDLIIPQLRLNIDVKLSRTTFTMAYINKVKALTGRVNDAPFPPTKGGFFDENFAAGEVLCIGVTGSSRKAGETTIGIAFAIEENRTITVGHDAAQITIPKLGWEYIWTWDEDKAVIADGNDYMLPAPKYAMAETVYPEGDFSTLGLT